MSAYYKRAEVLSDQGRYDCAEQELRRHLTEYPEDGHALAFLALCLARQQRLDEALAAAWSARGLEPEDAYVHFALAAVLGDTDEFVAAAAAMEEAIRLEPRRPRYFAKLAWIRNQREDWPGAIAATDRGLEIDPRHVSCLKHKAFALLWLGRMNESRALLEQALAIDPEDADSHADEARRLILAGDWASAVAHAKEALRLDPMDAQANAWLGAANYLGFPPFRAIFWCAYRWPWLWHGDRVFRLFATMTLGMVVAIMLSAPVLLASMFWPRLSRWLEPVCLTIVLSMLAVRLVDPMIGTWRRLVGRGRLAISRRLVADSNRLLLVVSMVALVYASWRLAGHRHMGLVAFSLALAWLPLSGALHLPTRAVRYVVRLCDMGMSAVGACTLSLVLVGSPGILAAAVRQGFPPAVVLAQYFAFFLYLLELLSWMTAESRSEDTSREPTAASEAKSHP